MRAGNLEYEREKGRQRERKGERGNREQQKSLFFASPAPRGRTTEVPGGPCREGSWPWEAPSERAGGRRGC